MTTRAQRTVEIAASPRDVWSFLSDPEKRANSISVIEEFELDDETHATWYLSLPIPVIDETIAIETEDTARDPVEYIKFVGRARLVSVIGEHELEPTDRGTRLDNRFMGIRSCRWMFRGMRRLCGVSAWQLFDTLADWSASSIE